MKTLKFCALILASATVGFWIVGCGDSGGPNPKVEEARVNTAIEMRKLFDKAGGDYTKLDATDKATFDNYAGGPEAAQKTWSMMKNGAAGGTSTSPGANAGG